MDTFLATCDSENKLNIYTKDFLSNSHNFFINDKNE